MKTKNITKVKKICKNLYLLNKEAKQIQEIDGCRSEELYQLKSAIIEK